MDIEVTPDIRCAIDAIIKKGKLDNLSRPTRYWYPLSLPTYGTDEILEAVSSMCLFRTSMGEKTRQFERRFAEYQECAHALMVNSGSSADFLLGLLLTDPLSPLLNAGDEVIVPVVTWPTQIWSMMMSGLKVKLVDVDPTTLNVDLDDLERCISERTRAIFIVHLMGNPCQMDRILKLLQKNEIYLIEDCCEAMGATWNGTKVGNFGIGAAFSFFFSHHITTMEGGMVTVNDSNAAERLHILRAHGWIRGLEETRHSTYLNGDVDPRYVFVDWGVNVRPTEVQAAFGIHQLEKARLFAVRREQIASTFFSHIAQRTNWLSAPRIAPQASPSWLALPLLVAKDAPFSRTEIASYLEDVGVETRPIVAGNIARHPVAARVPALRERHFPGADEVHERGFYIGLSPAQTDETVWRLAEAFSHFLSRY